MITQWMLEQELATAMQAAVKNGIQPPDYVAQQFAARADAYERDDPGRRLLTVVGETAVIAVDGVLTPTPDIMALWFGGGNTTYSELLGAKASAEADDRVSQIEVRWNSPGGSVLGLFEAIADLQAQSGKPIRSRVQMACSAAYALAVQCGELIAESPASFVGCVGIVQTLRVDPTVYAITSTKAPKKRPDPSTAEGVAVIREELDPLHELFVEAIADARGVTVDDVNANFGQGLTMIARDAVNVNMIDSIAPSGTTLTAATTGGQTAEAKLMNLDELKAQHPALYDAAVAEGKKLGASDERERVMLHLEAGRANHAEDYAMTAVSEGKAFDNTAQGHYFNARMAMIGINAAKGEESEVEAALNGADHQTGADDDIEGQAQRAAAAMLRGE